MSSFLNKGFFILFCVTWSACQEIYGEDENCDQKIDGRYPMRNCFQYMVCENNRKNVILCQEGELYSGGTQTCVQSKNVTEETYCQGRFIGDWMNPWDCHHFITCNMGWFTDNNCKDSLAYDPINNTCLEEKDVPFCAILAKVEGVLSSNHTTIQIQVYNNPQEQITKTNANKTNNGADESSKQTSPNQNTSDLITPAELQGLLKVGDVRLIDVREPWELTNEGKIGHSVNIPLKDISYALALSPLEFRQRYNFEKPTADDCSLVFHCRTGIRSQHALDIAKSLGYKCAKSLEGGFKAWKQLYV